MSKISKFHYSYVWVLLYCTVCASTVCMFVLKVFVLYQSSFVMLQSILSYYYYPHFCFIVLFVMLAIVYVPWSVLFLLMYTAVLAFCVQEKGPMPPGGNPTAVNKYRRTPKKTKHPIPEDLRLTLSWFCNFNYILWVWSVPMAVRSAA